MRTIREVAQAIKILAAVVAICLLGLSVVSANNVPAWCPDNINPANCATGN